MKTTKIYIVKGCYNDWNKVYIGKTINKSRKNDHKRKYGYDIDYEILEEINGVDKKLWKPQETYWINYYINLGFEVLNKQLKGGSGVEFHSLETKQKISQWVKQNRIRVRKDIESKKDEIIKLYLDGLGPHNLGKKFQCHPDVIKRILRESNTQFRTPSESQKCRKGEKRRKDIWDRIAEIKLLYLKGKNYTELGKTFNTSDVQIKNMLKKENTQ
jgi:Mor family transcriptional regulator